MDEKNNEVKIEEEITNGENNNITSEVNEEKSEKEVKTEENKKEHHKKKHHEDNEKLMKLSKEEIIKEYDKLLIENEKLTKLNAEKEKESIEYLDRYRRTLADMENLRKRVAIEKQDALKYANFNIVGDLLTILDDFQRAIDSGKSGSVDFSNYQTGIEMIEKQFIELLFKKYGVSKFGEKGEEFDPNKHSAMLMEEGDFKQEEIIEVFRSGYSLHDRVIRAAQVKIGKPKM
ncbi:MAG TPA: nucleotide exchange factor GrpE [Spirochaetota bacterium]|nr:nucleotide exchange factor GrpE [Spirochaetota bacterium]